MEEMLIQNMVYLFERSNVKSCMFMTQILSLLFYHGIIPCTRLNVDWLVSTAEKRTKNKEEKKASLEAIELIKSIIDGKIIWIKCGKWGKYGRRMLGILYLTEEDVRSETSINHSIVEK